MEVVFSLCVHCPTTYIDIPLPPSLLSFLHHSGFVCVGVWVCVWVGVAVAVGMSVGACVRGCGCGPTRLGSHKFVLHADLLKCSEPVHTVIDKLLLTSLDCFLMCTMQEVQQHPAKAMPNMHCGSDSMRDFPTLSEDLSVYKTSCSTIMYTVYKMFIVY